MNTDIDLDDMDQEEEERSSEWWISEFKRMEQENLHEEAMELLREACEKQPADTFLGLVYARALELDGEHEAASEHYMLMLERATEGRQPEPLLMLHYLHHIRRTTDEEETWFTFLTVHQGRSIHMTWDVYAGFAVAVLWSMAEKEGEEAGKKARDLTAKRALDAFSMGMQTLNKKSQLVSLCEMVSAQAEFLAVQLNDYTGAMVVLCRQVMLCHQSNIQHRAEQQAAILRQGDRWAPVGGKADKEATLPKGLTSSMFSPLVDWRFIERLLDQWETYLERFNVGLDIKRRFHNLRYNLSPDIDPEDEVGGSRYAVPVRRRLLGGQGPYGNSKVSLNDLQNPAFKIPLFNDTEDEKVKSDGTELTSRGTPLSSQPSLKQLLQRLSVCGEVPSTAVLEAVLEEAAKAARVAREQVVSRLEMEKAEEDIASRQIRKGSIAVSQRPDPGLMVKFDPLQDKSYKLTSSKVPKMVRLLGQNINNTSLVTPFPLAEPGKAVQLLFSFDLVKASELVLGSYDREALERAEHRIRHRSRQAPVSHVQQAGPKPQQAPADLSMPVKEERMR